MDALLPALRRIADGLLEDSVAERGVKPSCRAGCAACCRQLVPLAPAEARDLRRRVARLPDPLRRWVLASFSRAKRQVEAAGLLELLQERACADGEGLELLGRQYLAERIDCPLLRDERCLIYADRPLACRQHAVSSSPALCAEPGARVQRIPPLGRAVNAALTAEEGGAWVPLVLALDAPDDRSVEARAPMAWLTVIWRRITGAAGRAVHAPARRRRVDRQPMCLGAEAFP